MMISSLTHSLFAILVWRFPIAVSPVPLRAYPLPLPACQSKEVS
jgi:hypothetical protein